MKQTKLISVLFVILILFTFTSCGDNNNTPNSPDVSVSDSFTFETQDIYGEKVTSDIFRNSKITMVNVWATFCAPCIYEMPFLGELSEEYDKNDFQIVRIVSDTIDYYGEISQELVNEAKEIAKQTGAKYTHLIPEGNVGRFIYDVSAVPTTFFVDSNGSVIGEYIVGSKNKADWKTIIDEKLQEVQK